MNTTGSLVRFDDSVLEHVKTVATDAGESVRPEEGKSPRAELLDSVQSRDRLWMSRTFESPSLEAIKGVSSDTEGNSVSKSYCV